MTYTLHDRVVSLILLIEAWFGIVLVAYAVWAGGYTCCRGVAAVVVAVAWTYAREWRAMVTQ